MCLWCSDSWMARETDTSRICSTPPDCLMSTCLRRASRPMSTPRLSRTNRLSTPKNLFLSLRSSSRRPNSITRSPNWSEIPCRWTFDDYSQVFRFNRVVSFDGKVELQDVFDFSLDSVNEGDIGGDETVDLGGLEIDSDGCFGLGGDEEGGLHGGGHGGDTAD